MGGTKVTVNLKAVNLYLLIALLVILGFSLYAIMDVGKQFKDIEPPEPPKISQLAVTVITAPDCDSCLEASVFTGALQQLPLVEVTENVIEYGEEAQALISKYSITKLPAAIVTGEIENVTIPSFTKTDDAYVFTELPAPYYDLDEKKIIGEVKITYITDAGCPLCFDITQFSRQLTQLGVAITDEQEIDYNTYEGKSLIAKYSIKNIPTMIMSEDALEYDLVSQVWDQVGSQEADGMLVMRNGTPPYRDLETRFVRGLVTLTLLSDETCEECYNVSMHELVLAQSFGMNFKDVKLVDVSSSAGKKLVDDYSITQVPTMILDKEATAYSGFETSWEPVGTKEADGTFIFREVELLQGVQYKDLSTGEVSSSQG